MGLRSFWAMIPLTTFRCLRLPSVRHNFKELNFLECKPLEFLDRVMSWVCASVRCVNLVVEFCCFGFCGPADLCVRTSCNRELVFLFLGYSIVVHSLRETVFTSSKGVNSSGEKREKSRQTSDAETTNDQMFEQKKFIGFTTRLLGQIGTGLPPCQLIHCVINRD